MGKLDWERARERDLARDAPKKPRPPQEPSRVHPNSTAARKWGRRTWFKSS